MGVLSAAVEVVAPVSSDGVPAYPTGLLSSIQPSTKSLFCSLKNSVSFIILTICLDWFGWFDGFDGFDGDETMLGVKRKAAGIFFYRSKSVEELTLLPLLGSNLDPTHQWLYCIVIIHQIRLSLQPIFCNVRKTT